jgi:pyruvate,orthophosphate dikinase
MADERAGARAVHRIARDLPIGEGDSPDSVGFKAYNLSRMARLGLDVPPCIVIGTGYCDAPAAVIPSLWADDLAWLEASTGLGFGDRRRPLLLSVRSGAPVSMPGMMETLLNIGLTERTLPGLIRLTGNPRLAWDAYRRLIASFGEVVEGLEASIFEADLKAVVAGREERDLDFADMRVLTQRHLETYRRGAGAAFPDDPHEQLRRAVEAVFRSWSSAKAGTYRQMHRLSESMGTAVTIQQMVFGNAGGLSGAGVGFTRNPIDGNPAPWVDFLFNAQGEDVVSGRRNASVGEELAFVAPAIWDQLRAACASLEREFLDMQDFEFTLQSGRLFMLQTRDGASPLICMMRD